MIRRNFVKTAGLVLSTSAIGISSVAAEQSQVSLEEVGLENEVQHLLLHGETEEAKQLMDANNVNYESYRTKTKKPRSDDVSTHHFIEDDSWADCVLTESSDDGEWLVTGNWHLEGDYVDGDWAVATPEDIAAIC